MSTSLAKLVGGSNAALDSDIGDIDTDATTLEALRNSLGFDGPQMESVTVDSLRQKKSLGQLVPGKQYRITDYYATVDTSLPIWSRQERFDLIVTANSNNVLNAKARAIQHSAQDYFRYSQLEKWQVWYDIDGNNTTYTWAERDSINTVNKGVIYRLIDEFGNDCPYDFKNIVFLREVDGCQMYFPTFGMPDFYGPDAVDYSLEADRQVFRNKIASYRCDDDVTWRLPVNIFIGQQIIDNGVGPNSTGNVFGWGDSYGSSSSGMGLGGAIFGNRLGRDCYDNTFCVGCQNVGLGNSCHGNKIGGNCGEISFGDDCSNNDIQYYAFKITFGSGCNSNIIGPWSREVTFGSSCIGNVFGDPNNIQEGYENILYEHGASFTNLICTADRMGGSFRNVIVSGVSGNVLHRKDIMDSNYEQQFSTTYKPAESKEISV